MSYCRFENTLSDLQDCADEMGEAGSLQELDLSQSEERAFVNMRELLTEMLVEMNAMHEEASL